MLPCACACMCGCLCMCVCVPAFGEDYLRLAVTDAFATTWVADQWPTWKQAWAARRFSADAFVPSLASQRRRERLAGKGGAPRIDSALPEHSVSTAALVLLLTRWRANLKGVPSARAGQLLASLLASMPSFTWHVESLEDSCSAEQHCWPAPPGCDMQVPIAAGVVFPKALLASAGHARDLARSFMGWAVCVCTCLDS